MLLGAYYYIWYGRPTLPIIGGGVWKSGYSHQPLLGEYSSQDAILIKQHIDWAKKAGIDFLAINWANAGSWDDLALKDFYLKNAKCREIKFCLHYDSSLTLNRIGTLRSYDYDFNDDYSPGKTKGDKFLEDFQYLADHFFTHPQYLKINGKPVVIIYNVSSFRNIEKYFRKLPPLFLIADVVCWAGIRLSMEKMQMVLADPFGSMKIGFRALRRLSPKNYENDFSLSKFFQGITGYNMYATNRTDRFLENIDKLYQRFKDYAKDNKLVFVPNVMPGYDDRKLMGLENPALERNEGKFYKEFWKIAEKYLDSSVQMALITSFNEWHEGTEIEPSKEHQTRYLEITKEVKSNYKS